jgi:hypothetical protein
MSKFKTGDKVVFTSAIWHERKPQWYPAPGTVGTVLYDNTGYIQWPKGSTSRDDAWLADESMIAPCKPQNKIIITTDGVTTLAKLYDGKTIVRSATAKCSPSDTYDFATGANLAYNRLMFGADYHPAEVAFGTEQDKPKYWSGKVVCTSSFIGYTQGKVYAIKDGLITDDDGDVRSLLWTAPDSYSPTFIEYKGGAGS